MCHADGSPTRVSPKGQPLLPCGVSVGSSLRATRSARPTFTAWGGYIGRHYFKASSTTVARRTPARWICKSAVLSASFEYAPCN